MSAALLWTLTLLVATSDAQRAPSATSPIAIATSSECPGEAAVTAALVPLLKLDSIRSTDGPARVADLGDRFEVTAAGQVGVYTDAGRDCSERARVAAVFIALALNPPAFQPRSSRSAPPSAPPKREDNRDEKRDERREDKRDEKREEKRDERKDLEESRAAPPPIVEAPAPPTRPAVPWVRLAVGGRLEAAPKASDRPATTGTFGLDVEGAGGLDDFGVAIGAGVRAPTVTTFSSVSVREQRFPFGVTGVGRYRVANSLELAGQAGVALVLLRLRDESPGGLSPSTRLELGARAAVELRLPALSPRMYPFAGLSFEYFPRPYRYTVEPLGQIGTSAPVWLGVTLGLWFQRL